MPAAQAKQKARHYAERSCSECGKLWVTRTDSDAIRCKSCGARRGHAAAMAVVRERPNYGRHLARHPRGSRQVARICKQCSGTFSRAHSQVFGTSNSSGNFCSRACYHIWLSDTAYTGSRGSRWRHHRREALRRAPFCAVCATPKRLQVHHIIPYRMTHDNAQDNLVPLCRTHHKIVEHCTLEFLATGVDLDIAQLMLRNGLRERQMASATVLKGLLCDRA